MIDISCRPRENAAHRGRAHRRVEQRPSPIPNTAPLDNSTAVEAGDASGWEGGVTAVDVAADGTVAGKGASGAAGMLEDVSLGISTLAAIGDFRFWCGEVDRHA